MNDDDHRRVGKLSPVAEAMLDAFAGIDGPVLVGHSVAGLLTPAAEPAVGNAFV
jgi:hypothetical protein